MDSSFWQYKDDRYIRKVSHLLMALNDTGVGLGLRCDFLTIKWP